MKRCLCALLLMAGLCGGISVAVSSESRRLVLVTNPTSSVRSLTAGETRRLFLGLPVSKDGHPLEAFINRSDPFLYQVFLQKIIFMSSSVYERHLLTNVVQMGGQRPPSFTDTHSLVKALDKSPDTVAVMWEDQARASQLTILGEIWHGTED